MTCAERLYLISWTRARTFRQSQRWQAMRTYKQQPAMIDGPKKQSAKPPACYTCPTRDADRDMRNLASLIFTCDCRGKPGAKANPRYLAWEASVLPLNYTRVLHRNSIIGFGIGKHSACHS